MPGLEIPGSRFRLFIHTIRNLWPVGSHCPFDLKKILIKLTDHLGDSKPGHNFAQRIA